MSGQNLPIALNDVRTTSAIGVVQFGKHRGGLAPWS
jgi:hypothetical protein